MRVGNKIFPYPILNNIQQLSNYLDYKFEILFDYDENPLEIKLNNLRFESDSSYINDLYKNEIIKVVCIVECSDTAYRKRIDINNEGINLILYKADLSEKTNLAFFAYANKNFIMKSDEFDEDYQGIEFSIDKYDILAVNDDKIITVKHQEKEYDLAHSIFSVVNQHSKNDGMYEVDYSLNKITIYLSDEDYNNYKVIANVNEYKETFFCMLLIPVLVEALTACKIDANSGATLEDIGDARHWFRSITSSYKKIHNEELTLDTFKSLKAIDLAQELLGKPLNTSFKRMIDARSIPTED